jgi:hypothetical protein
MIKITNTATRAPDIVSVLASLFKGNAADSVVRAFVNNGVQNANQPVSQ